MSHSNFINEPLLQSTVNDKETYTVIIFSHLRFQLPHTVGLSAIRTAAFLISALNLLSNLKSPISKN